MEKEIENNTPSGFILFGELRKISSYWEETENFITISPYSSIGKKEVPWKENAYFPYKVQKYQEGSTFANQKLTKIFLN